MNIQKHLLILIIVIAIWFFINNFKEPKPLITIGDEPSSKTIDILKSDTKIKKKNFDFSERSLTDDPIQNQITEPDPNLTYLQAYRNTIVFKKCFSIVNDINKDISPLIQFKKDASLDFYNFTEESQKQATKLQIQYYSDFIDLCQSFLKDNHENFTSALKRLHDIFSSIEPKTESEKQLAEGLELYMFYQELIQLKSNTTQSYSLLSEEEKSNINSDMKNLYNQIKELKTNPDWQTNNQIQILINELNNKISNNRNKVRNNKVTNTDDKTKKKLEVQILLHKNEMINFLKSNNSPDILLLYAKLIFYPGYLRDDTILNEMKRELNTYDSHLLLSLHDVGIKLAACAMNYPCSDQSEFILDYCIGGFKNMSNYPSACGKTLDEFYFNHYLSPNQLEDVSKYLNYILENYAK